MAGIGFELRHILSRGSYTATLRAYTYAGLISSGPWVLSILSVMLVGIFSLSLMMPEIMVSQFLVTVTYLMASSLIVTGGVQLLFTRFVSDRIFEKRDDAILPNLLGILLVTTVSSGILGAIILLTLFDQPFTYCLLVLANFVMLCDLWLVVIFISGMKAYNRILLVMLLGYSLMVASAFVFQKFHLDGLLFSFLLGNSTLFFLFIYDIIRNFPAKKLISFDFLDKRNVFGSLLITGFCYNLGVWIDKILFWFNEGTSNIIIGPLRASVLYDFPIFIAYLAIIPGMAVFLVRIETDFAEWYERLFSGIRDGDSLQNIKMMKIEMTLAIRRGLLDIVKVQALIIVIVMLFAPKILNWLGISNYYLPLLYVDLIGVSIQLVFMALLNIFFYLDKRILVMKLCAMFVLFNGILTSLTLYLGPSFFGYGFTLSLCICVIIGLIRLTQVLDDLEYETFM